MEKNCPGSVLGDGPDPSRQLARMGPPNIQPLHGLGLSNEASAIRDSLQYYRIWIYSCNGVLGVTSLIFTIFGGLVLTDSRLTFLSDVNLHHPTFLYGYLALVLQSGVVQSVGCIGASRLSNKLLCLYWVLLLFLTLGDVIVGLVWVFKLDKVKLSLMPGLTSDLISKYNQEDEWSQSWNNLQSSQHCCGVAGPLDYKMFLTPSNNKGQNPGASTRVDFSAPGVLTLPESCCTLKLQLTSNINLTPSVPIPVSPSMRGTKRKRSITVSDEIVSGFDPIYPMVVTHQALTNKNTNLGSTGTQHRIRHFVHHRKKLGGTWNQSTPFETNITLSSAFFSSDTGIPATTKEPSETVSEISEPFYCQPLKSLAAKSVLKYKRNVGISVGISSNGLSENPKPKIRVYRNGCSMRLLQWLDHVTGIMFILGFCIIGFIKVCFLVILRYEIREMIEKIQMLNQNENTFKINSPRSTADGLVPNFLQKQLSTQSGGTQITIKSPGSDLESLSYGNHIPRHPINSQGHFQHYLQPCRRPSANLLGGSASQSQETVNMTLLVTSSCPIREEKQSGNEKPNIICEGEETFSLEVPNPEETSDGVRNNTFPNYCTWTYNVSGDSSASSGYPDPPSVTNGSHPSLTQSERKQVVEVNLEHNIVKRLPKSNSCDESISAHFPESRYKISENRASPFETEPLLNSFTIKPCYRNCSNEKLAGAYEEGNEGMTSSLALSSVSTQSPPSTSSALLTPPSIHKTGIHKVNSSDTDLDSDLIMALIGTAV